jgi:acyl dehydratase
MSTFLEIGPKVGQEVGVSDWLRIDQPMIDAFASATLDPDPMHVDPEWSARFSPFRTTIAFGFQTISLLTFLSHQALKWTHEASSAGGGYGLNYGFDRLRLLNPVPVNSRIRARFTLLSQDEPNPGEVRTKLGVAVEIEGQEKPALVAEWLGLWIAGSAGHRRLESRHRS